MLSFSHGGHVPETHENQAWISETKSDMYVYDFGKMTFFSFNFESIQNMVTSGTFQYSISRKNGAFVLCL
jgi:hypothetical protein